MITVSTRAAHGVYADEAGPAVAGLLRDGGFDVGDVVLTPDSREGVAAAIREASADAVLVITTGGTGIGPDDLTPEATRDVIDREVPGIAEMMRSASAAITPMAALSRAVAGVRGTTLVVNLPGSVKAARENLAAIAGLLDHALEQLQGGDHTR